ncbi:calsyntenin-1-like [Mya arenaria]|uniref:calsyntenin-1-like n=1 Tax=Mya arenaria TaxID=6604 RepID=UPI0022E6515F|nr:calsyntenin-1-like [Mya arenaria]
MDKLLFYLSCTILLGLSRSTSEPNAYAPEIISTLQNSRDIPLFRGSIQEDETTVHLEPQLFARDNDTVGAARLICRYEIVANRKNIPFEIELKNRETGEGVLKVREGEHLNFEKRKHYKFNIFAYDCVDPPYSKRSNRAVVTVKVLDVDKFAPVFDKTTYSADLLEGTVSSNIIQVHAHDDDRSPENSGICGYDIVSDDAPFLITNDGILQNTKSVYHTDHYSFILKIRARDCRGMVSEPAYINIMVKEKCRNGWTDFPDHIEYTPGTGRHTLTDSAHLQVCEESCTVDRVTVKMTLQTKHIGKGCDRDTYSIISQRKLCGASDGSVDLLPAPTLTSNWTNAIPTDDGNDGDKIYAFDGETNHVVVPEGHVDHTLREHFTISTWMKHSPSDGTHTKHTHSGKEHLLCMSDGDGMSRHHYALFIHNGKLVFVLRRESAKESDLEVFKPAEWRWKISEVDDGQWHHYAFTMNFPELHLYVDGKLVEATQDNFEILDDWPLHPTDRVHFTKLVVGACWKGLDETYVDHFHGFVAGLSLLKDRTESERVIQCLNNCQENLDFTDLEDMPSGTSVSFNSDMTEFSITGRNASDVEMLVRKVAYVNNRNFPTPGRRNLNIRTSVHCGQIEEILPLKESYIFVEHSSKPVITVTGKNLVLGHQSELDTGLPVFKDVSIHVDFMLASNSVEDSEDESEEIGNDTSDMHDADANTSLLDNKIPAVDDSVDSSSTKILLDMCTVRAEPVLDFYVEHLELPKDDIKTFNMKLEGIETAAGLVILNADTIENYMTVLHDIRYIHTQAGDLYMRKFVISCSSQSGRFVSNEFEINVGARQVEEEPRVVPVANIQNSGAQQSIVEPKFQNHLAGAAGTNFGMVAIIVVCVGFLLFMIVLGVLRIRAAHHHRRVPTNDNGQEMEWDNSELNIIVNPIDQELFEYEEHPHKATLPDDSDTDDDISECFQDDEDNDSSEEEMETAVKTLEWDDSAY